MSLEKSNMFGSIEKEPTSNTTINRKEESEDLGVKLEECRPSIFFEGSFGFKAEVLENFYVEPTRGFIDSDIIYKKGDIVEIYKIGLKNYLYLGYGTRGVKCFASYDANLLKKVS